jgi:predicted PurR-regulated permease PerM
VLLQFSAFLVQAAATVVLLFFLLASERWLVARTIQVIPRRRARALVLSAVRTAQREMSYYFGTQLLINCGVGIAVGLACWWLGLPGAALWGAGTALLNFIPYLGPFVAGVLMTIAGILTFDTLAQSLGPVTALIIVHAIEANVVSPLVMAHRLQLSPLALFLSVMLWGWLWGVAGALIAVPVLLTVRIVFHRVRALRVWASYLDRSQEMDIPSLRALLRPPRTSLTVRLRRRHHETGSAAPGRSRPT